MSLFSFGNIIYEATNQIFPTLGNIYYEATRSENLLWNKEAKVGILSASLLAGGAGFLILKFLCRKK